MGCCACISQSEVGIMETCGKFTGLASPGCVCMLPWTSIVKRLTLRLVEHTCSLESKTKDNVFVNLRLTIQFQIIPTRVDAAHYKVQNPHQTMEDLILNSVRAKIPLYKLEALYVERGTISQQLKEEVDGLMEEYGVEIVSALISDIEPGKEITQAMDDIQRLQRMRVATVDEAETKKLRRVRAAEAQCESRRLAGEGLAEQRKAIVAGLMQSIEEVCDEVPGLTNVDATNMLLMNQYYDTLTEVSRQSKSSVMVLETNGGLEKVAEQLKKGVTEMMR